MLNDISGNDGSQREGNSGSTTTTTIEQPSNPILHLRPDTSHTPQADKKSKIKKKKRSKVRWTEDVVDNENLNKKKSKICCIFHPQREFGELSSDSSSDSSSSDSSSSDISDIEGEGNSNNNNNNNDTNENSNSHDCCSHAHSHSHKNKKNEKNKKKSKQRDSSPNAYERQPTYNNISKVPNENGGEYATFKST